MPDYLKLVGSGDPEDKTKIINFTFLFNGLFLEKECITAVSFLHFDGGYQENHQEKSDLSLCDSQSFCFISSLAVSPLGSVTAIFVCHL